MLATGRVAWFNLEKKFGFVALDTGGDAFLHVSVLKAAGYVTLPPGTVVEVRLEKDRGNTRVTEVIRADTSTAKADAPAPVLRKRQPARSLIGDGEANGHRS